MKTARTKLFIIIIVLTALEVSGQSGVAINSSGNPADSSAILDINSTTDGILVPRMSKTERNAIPGPATSLLIYQTDSTEGFYYNSGTPSSPVWTQLASSSSSGGDCAILIWGNGSGGISGDLSGYTIVKSYPWMSVASQNITLSPGTYLIESMGPPCGSSYGTGFPPNSPPTFTLKQDGVTIALNESHFTGWTSGPTYYYTIDLTMVAYTTIAADANFVFNMDYPPNTLEASTDSYKMSVRITKF